MRHRTPFHKTVDAGFSFIELLAYMAIAALLILAAIPQFNQYREKAVVSNLENDVHNASLAAEATRIDQDSVSAISAAMPQVKTSDDGTTLVTADLGSGDYLIRGSNPRTDTVVIYASRTDTDTGTKAGLNIIKPTPSGNDGSGAPGQVAAACSVDADHRDFCEYLDSQLFSAEFVKQNTVSSHKMWILQDASGATFEEKAAYQDYANDLITAWGMSVNDIVGGATRVLLSDEASVVMTAYAQAAQNYQAQLDTFVVDGKFVDSRSDAAWMAQKPLIDAAMEQYKAQAAAS